jgi:hypothetical protein
MDDERHTDNEEIRRDHGDEYEEREGEIPRHGKVTPPREDPEKEELPTGVEPGAER